ncbi:hypothetical protein GCM10009765_62260 [Fodinicola feengrottensis]|uniref:Secreted protein n=1 Tax=Fodinicola feengrottensis TaxID=435914 RepID=A0ABP4UIS2_9ACTN
MTVSFSRGLLPTVHLVASSAAVTCTTAAVQAPGADGLAVAAAPTAGALGLGEAGGKLGDGVGATVGLGLATALGEAFGWTVSAACWALGEPPPKAHVVSVTKSTRMTAATSPRRRQ